MRANAWAACAALLNLFGAHATTARAQQGPPPTPVHVDAVTQETLQQRRMVTGEVRASKRVNVAVEEAGIVSALAVREGDRVAKGDLVMRIDATRLELTLSELESELEQARALLNEAEVQSAYWAEETRVLEEASRRAAATVKELRDARFEAALSVARTASAQRSIERINARISLLQERLSDTAVRAPFDGVVVRRLTEIGAWVDEGEAAIELLGGEPEAWLDLPQSLLPAATMITGGSRTSPTSSEPGAEMGTPQAKPDADEQSPSVSARIDSTGSMHPLRSMRVVPDASRSTRTFSLVGVVDAPAGTLLVGGSAVAYVPTGELRPTLTISKDALLRGGSGPYVYVVRSGRDGSMATPVAVSVLFETERRTAIAPGALSPGDLVVTEGAERLRPGAAVEPMAQNEPRAASAGRTGRGDREVE